MPKTTLKGLSAMMHRLANNLPKEASKLAVKVGTVVVDDLANNTPVDTSQAVSNWQVRLGNPAVAPIFAYHLGEQGSTKAQSAQAVKTAASNAMKTKKPGIPIYITNVLPYIQRLNEGWSEQTPANFVERSVLLGRIEVRKARFKIL